MKFKINEREWLIKEVEQQELKELHNDYSNDGCYYGTTIPNTQEIWIFKDIKNEGEIK